MLGYHALMPIQLERPRRPMLFWRVVVEVAFILFLFYANLLMGEFTRSAGAGKTLGGAMLDIFTGANLAIGLVAALIGYVIFEQLRKMV